MALTIHSKVNRKKVAKTDVSLENVALSAVACRIFSKTNKIRYVERRRRRKLSPDAAAVYERFSSKDQPGMAVVLSFSLVYVYIM